jgi:hypothetical protein
MKKIIPIVIAIIVVGAGTFFGGMKYAESKNPLGGNLQNLSSDQRRQLFQQMGVGAGAGLRGGTVGNGAGAGLVAGDIIAKDANSVTIKLRDGGSKIVFFSDSTQVIKTVDGNSSDLEVGKSATVTGTTNSDGSITAKQIQVQPAITQP